MITLNISQEQLQNPEVANALGDLFKAITPESNARPERVKSNPRRDNHINPDIDPIILENFGWVISSKKSLHCLTVLRKHRRVASYDLYTVLKETYPELNPRAIGGIFGAMERWFKQNKCAVPFRKQKDAFGTLYFQWIVG